MASWKAHIFLYVVVGLLIVFFVENRNSVYQLGIPIEIFGVSFFVGLIYSILPDIDHPMSIIRRGVTFVVVSLFALAAIALYSSAVDDTTKHIFAGLILVGCILLLWMMFLRHKKTTHKLAFGILASLPWIFLHWFTALMAFVGFICHLIADSGRRRRK